MDKIDFVDNQKDDLTTDKIPLDVLLAKLKNLICKIAHKFAINDMNFYEDLISEGTCAVCEHYHEYDPSIAQPSTFFYPHIKSNIYIYYCENIKHTTPHYEKKTVQIKKAIDALVEANIPNPTIAQIKAEMKDEIGIKTISECLMRMQNKKMLAIDESGLDAYNSKINYSYNDNFKKNVLSAENIYMEKNQSDIILDSIASLPEIEKVCISMKYGFPPFANRKYTIIEITNYTNLSADKVKKHIKAAEHKLKEILIDKGLGEDNLKEKKKIQNAKSIGIGNMAIVDQQLLDIDDMLNDTP